MSFLLSTCFQSARAKAIALILLLLSVVVLAALFDEWVSFEAIKAIAVDSLSYVDQYPLLGMVIFAVFYFVICSLPTPFTSVFTMVAGYLFGNVAGLLITSFMSALGGTVMFILVRYLLRDWVQQRVALHSQLFEQASRSNSFSIALSLRLIPGMPFPAPAIILGLSQLSITKFYVSTQLGLFASLFVYVNAGRSLAQVHSIEDVFSLQLVLSLLLLALLPLVFGMIQRRISV